MNSQYTLNARKKVTRIRRLFVLGCSVLMIGGTYTLTPKAEAGPRGRGSVRHSSGSSRSRSASSRNRSRQPSRQPSRTTNNRGSDRNVNRGNDRNVNRGNDRNVNRGNDRNVNRGGDRNVNRGGDRNVNRGGNRNTNINVNVKNNYGRGGYNNWKDARRDWMRFRTVNHLIRSGTYLLSRPRYSTTVVVRGTPYYYWGGVYYVSSGTGYVVTYPPPTTVVYSIPTTSVPVYTQTGNTTNNYYYYGGTYYEETDEEADVPEGDEQKSTVEYEDEDGNKKTDEVESPEMMESESNFKVVSPPVGVTVPYLPDEAEEKKIDGTKYFVHEGTYYRPFASDGETIYMVVDDPTKKDAQGQADGEGG